MNFRHFVTLAVLALGSFASAKADSINGMINVTGVASSTATPGSIIFSGPGSVTGLGTTTLDFLPFVGTNVALDDFSYTSFVSPSPVFQETLGTETLTFSLDAITFAGSTVGNAFAITGTGLFTLTGFDPTPGIFSFTTQDGQTVASFSSTTTASPIPEPASFALFGTGLLGAAGIARRKLGVQFGRSIAQ
jgi:hypothetical protein